jgi:hypothetical protein
VVLLFFWAGVAWINWPWPNYGYCDFWPPLTWDFVAGLVPNFAFLISAAAVLVAVVRAAATRTWFGLFATIATALVWFLIAQHDFVPDAPPGDGCYDLNSGSLSSTSQGQGREQ